MVKKEETSVGGEVSGGRGQSRRSTRKNNFKLWKWILVIVIVVVVIYFLWNWIFVYKECVSWECFNLQLESCSKTEFIGGDSLIFEYIIRGRQGDFCEVDIALLQGDLDNQDSLKLQGNDMNCMLPYGVVMTPESDIGNCHGLLKEGLQDLIIRDLHTYIVKNLGQINLEVLPAPED